MEKEIVFQIVERFKSKYTIVTILGTLGVPRANYYRWCAKKVVQLSVKEEAIIKLCKKNKVSLWASENKSFVKKGLQHPFKPQYGLGNHAKA